MSAIKVKNRTYEVDVRGYLVDPGQWDEGFAIHRAHEMMMATALGERHWQVIRYLRDRFARTRMVPTIYETCRANKLELKDLDRLFPDGYYRGAVKIAGLRVR